MLWSACFHGNCKWEEWEWNTLAHTKSHISTYAYFWKVFLFLKWKKKAIERDRMPYDWMHEWELRCSDDFGRENAKTYSHADTILLFSCQFFFRCFFFSSICYLFTLDPNRWLIIIFLRRNFVLDAWGIFIWKMFVWHSRVREHACMHVVFSSFSFIFSTSSLEYISQSQWGRVMLHQNG